MKKKETYLLFAGREAGIGNLFQRPWFILKIEGNVLHYTKIPGGE